MNLLQSPKKICGKLQKKIETFASILLGLGVQPKHRVAIVLPRGSDAAIVIYAILTIGAIYVPLDITNPDLRLKSILIDASTMLVIGLGEKKNWCPDDVSWFSFKGLNNLIYQRKFCNVYKSRDSDLAAILYTSGSSGVPKGVALSHGAMRSFADWAGKTFIVTKKDRIANLSPFYFDLSVFDLFTSLRFGASIYYMPNELTFSPMEMVKWLKENRITIWYTVPTVLIFLTLKGNLLKESLPDLKKILFAGEVFPLPHLLNLTKLLPQVEFYNLFGPTETNVCCYWAVDRKKIKDLISIPIGYPACGNQLSISSGGELLVKGPSLMTGYFSKGKIKNLIDEKGWYHTGDSVSLGKEGELYYHGRLDFQLKCHGFRIEPEEIEKVLYSYPNIQECAVLGIKNKAGVFLVACLGADKEISLSALVQHLKNKLPSYMIPEKFVQMKSLPRFGNGKLNLLELKELIKI